MTATDPADASALTREAILYGLETLSDELVTLYYPTSHIPVKTQYLIEGLFDEGVI